MLKVKEMTIEQLKEAHKALSMALQDRTDKGANFVKATSAQMQSIRNELANRE